MRFVFIAQALGVVGAISEKLVSVGVVIKPLVISVAHSFIETRLGITIGSDLIITLLNKLQFQVAAEQQAHDIIYHVTVPTLRITKDVTIPEDIVEEVVRVYGYENISYRRPTRSMKKFDMSCVMKLRKIK